jgi:uncharacterized membrane protein YphA (DoxX/SURF4 family)
MHALFIIQGAQAPDAALTLNRVALGVFFAISGYCIGLTVVMLAGPGPWSLDARIAALLAS